MCRKLLPLVLALALCLSLTIPAAAYPSGSIWVGDHLVFQETGIGWSYDSENSDPAVLKLSGAQDLQISVIGSCVIELAPGTKSTMRAIFVEEPNLDGSIPTITFRGTGELEIFGSNTFGSVDAGALAGILDQEAALEDGLVMTGGTKAGDSYPLTLGPNFREPGHSYEWHGYQANGKPAAYIHIGPAGSAAPETPSTPETPLCRRRPSTPCPAPRSLR